LPRRTEYTWCNVYDINNLGQICGELRRNPANLMEPGFVFDPKRGKAWPLDGPYGPMVYDSAGHWPAPTENLYCSVWPMAVADEPPGTDPVAYSGFSMVIGRVDGYEDSFLLIPQTGPRPQ